MKYLETFLEEILSEVATIGAKYFSNINDDPENIYNSKLSKSEQYAWAVSNRIIHLNNLLEEIDYGFKVLEGSTLPKEDNDSYHHFVFCQRVMDYHISAIRDRTLQLVATIFCVQKLKDEVNWKIFNDPNIPSIVKTDFKKFSDSLKEYNDRKNNFLHRESIPAVMVTKDDKTNIDFKENFQTYKENWKTFLKKDIKFFKNLLNVYKETRQNFEE